jgi:hypothetical protein
MWVLLAVGSCWLYVMPGGPTREKRRIADGKGEIGLLYIRSSEGGSPCLCRLSTASVGPCCNKH